MGAGSKLREAGCLCQFCFLAPDFTRDTGKLVCVQEKEQVQRAWRWSMGTGLLSTPLQAGPTGTGLWGSGGWCGALLGQFLAQLGRTSPRRGPEMTHMKERDSKLRCGPVQSRLISAVLSQ